MRPEARADLCEALASRREQLPMRLIMGLGITISLGPVLGWPILAWLVVWVAIQIIERVWLTRSLRAGTLEAQALYGVVFMTLANILFGASALLAIGSGVTWTMVCGAVILAGGLMNAAASTRLSLLAYVATAAPAALYVVALPALAVLENASALEVWGALGTSVLLLSASLTMRRYTVRALEGERAANAAKSDFLATVSHEIRTPMNGVLGMAQAMAADDLSPAQRARLTTIRQSGETLLHLLNDILDLSKIEAGKLELDDAAFELTPLARAVHSAFAVAASEKALRFELEVDPAAAGIYRGDSGRLRQILYNLISNALKFTERGEVRVRISRDGRDLLIAVSDTGIGIAPDRLPRLFDKFEQAEASTTRRFGGTGLGLAISRELAALMGGRIRANSEEGRGSCFEVSLPLPRIADEKGAPDQDDRAVRPFADAKALRVLAAEDNPVNQIVLRTLLEQAGLEPTIVADGREALAAWRAQPWDVILMDVQMPGMDGPTTARAIRAEEAASGRARTPIIALTANAMSHQTGEYVASGMELLVSKPIEVEALFTAIGQAVEGSTPSAANARASR